MPPRNEWNWIGGVALLLAALLPGYARACARPVNPGWAVSVIATAAFHREFIVTGCADAIPQDGLPVVFAFHGGGQVLHDARGRGFLDFTQLARLGALVIAPVGNKSHNGHSWISAFPWMKPHPEDDLALPAALIAEIRQRTDLPRTNWGRVFALGKSDGAGMAMMLACQPPPGLPLAGVALVSGAYFGLGSATNFGHGGHAICLPDAAVAMLLIHGTGDQVMPYAGQNFRNAKALQGAADNWAAVEPQLEDPTRQTFSADIGRYVQALAAKVFRCADFAASTLGASTTVATGRGCAAPFEIITVRGGNHVWPGHPLSGPQSGQAPNMDFDATALIADFFSMGR